MLKKLDPFDEMDKLHERCKLPKVTQEEMDNLKSHKAITKINCN